jgi:polyisoprenoid-binding protein YceI
MTKLRDALDLRAAGPDPLSAGTWHVDPERTSVGFSVRHLAFSTVRGTVRVSDGTIRFDDHGLRVDGAADAASVDTGNDIRDRRIRNELFDAARHPLLRFSGGMRSATTVEGELSVGALSGPVAFEVDNEPIAGGAVRVTGAAEVSQKAFGIEWAALRDAGRLVVSDRVRLSVDAVFVRD